MIKNIIFDMGNVLIHFRPDLYIARLNRSKEESDLLMEKVYKSQNWQNLDNGSLSEAGFLEILSREIHEELMADANQLINEWDKPMFPVPGMSDLIRELKEQGYPIYLLSNASTRLHEYWSRIPGSEYFDGKLVSADVKMVKPCESIYHELFKTFGIKPEESVFIDDLPANIATSKRVGMDGFVFKDDVEELRAWLGQKLGE